MNFYNFYCIFEVNKKGKLTIKNVRGHYYVPKGTEYPLWKTIPLQKKGVEITEIYELYLKAMSISDIITTERKTENGYLYTTLQFPCLDYKRCVTKKNSDETEKYLFLAIKGTDNAKKLTNAFKYLIESAKKEVNFLEKDPFSDR